MSTSAITVRNSHELSVAINTLSDGNGGVILVENTEETYAVSKFRAGTDAGEILITAADPGDPPTFAQVKLVQGQNMTFSNLSFDSTQSDIPGKDLEILQSSDITFEDNTFVNASNGFFTGEDDGISMGSALALIRDSEDFTFTGNDVSKYGQGLAIVDSVGTVITDNTISQMTGDGLRMSGVQDTLVEGNTFTDFFGSTQNVNHSDMIQVWSAPYNTLNTENLMIRDNFLNSAGGVATQAIFIKNETFDETNTVFRDITIENNTIYNGHVHGVAMYHTEGVQITDNTLLWDEQATMQSTPTSKPVSNPPTIRLIEIEGAVVTGNIVAHVTAPAHNTVSDNAYVTYNNPADENYVGNHFVNVKDPGLTDLRDMTLLADSAWNGAFGSDKVQADSPVEELTAVIRQQSDPSIFGLVHYDASQSRDMEGFLDAGETDYIWTFYDGTVLQGMQVSHRSEIAGQHDVTLEVRKGADAVASATRITDVKENTLVAFDFENGVSDISPYDSVLTEVGSHPEVDGVTGAGFALTGSNRLRIESDNDHIYNLPSFTLNLALMREPGGDAGTFLHMHKGLRAEITEDGSFKFTLRTSDGVFIAQTEPGLVSTGEWHDLKVTFSESSGGLKLYVDGELATTTEATGIMVTPEGMTPYDLVVGNSWGSSLQGRIDDFSLTRSVDDATAGHSGETPTAPNVGSESEEMDDGCSEQAVSPLEDASLLRLDFEDGVDDLSDSNAFLKVKESTPQEAADMDLPDGGFVLTGQSKILVDRSNAHIHEMDSFTLGLSLARAPEGDAGTFVHIHKALNIRITDDGALKVNMTTTDGRFEAMTPPGLVEDAAWHRIAVTYDGAAGGDGLKLYIDGALQAETDASGAMASTGTYHMVFGNTWIDSLQGSIDEVALEGSALSAEDVLQDALASKCDGSYEAPHSSAPPVSHYEPVMLALMAQQEALDSVEPAFNQDADSSQMKHDAFYEDMANPHQDGVWL